MIVCIRCTDVAASPLQRYVSVHPATGRFDLVRFVGVNVLNNVFVAIDLPRPGTTVDRPFVIAGWAADAAARSGTGVDAIHI
jgi:hypothetical protein